MQNNFFENCHDKQSIALRLKQLQFAKVGLYSVGLYPASLAYNCAMQTDGNRLLLAPRPGRDILGAFSEQSRKELEPEYVDKMRRMSLCKEDGINRVYTLKDLFLKCELVILSSNSNHIENDLLEACRSVSYTHLRAHET